MASTGYRIFKQRHIKGKKIIRLVTWIDRKCSKCKRILAKENKTKLCPKCTLTFNPQEAKHAEYMRKYRKTSKFREWYKKYHSNKADSTNTLIERNGQP